MPKYRNIRVKMKGGKSRIQRAMVLASGKLRFVKNARRKAKRPKGKVWTGKGWAKARPGVIRGRRGSGYVFTAARRAAAKRNLKHGRSKRRRPSRRSKAQTRRRHRSRKSIRRRSRSGGIGLG